MAGAEPVAFLEAGKEDARLRVEFYQRDDLLTHAIFLLQGTERIEIARSFEGDGEDIPPYVPCFSQLHQQRETLLLTGANGACHWSMSVQVGQVHELDIQRIPRIHPTLFFDVACRLKELHPQISTQYIIAEDRFRLLDVSSNTGQSYIHSEGSPASLFIGAAHSGYCLAYSPQPECKVSSAVPGKMEIHSTRLLPHEVPTTVQWSYAVWRLF